MEEERRHTPDAAPPHRRGQAWAAGARGIGSRMWAALRAVGRGLASLLRLSLQVGLALVILFEEWGWEPLARLLGRLARWRPWARLEAAIARLPPYGALVAFALPTLLLLPLKFLAVLLIAKGQLVLAGLLFAAAKVGATGLIARLFMLTQPALMQIPWFARAHGRFMPWKAALETYVRSTALWRVGHEWKAALTRAAMVLLQRVRSALARWREAARTAARRLRIRTRRLARALRARWVMR